MVSADLLGWASVIAALGVAVPAILVAINSFRNTAKIDGNTAKIAEVHDLVNGQSEKITRLAEAKGYAEGVADSPTEPK